MGYRGLFVAFFRIGILGYGGGPTMIPLIHDECVKRYKWVTDEDFSDYLAMGNAMPGPIATKMAAYVGYKVKGWRGALLANVALILPTVIIMIALLEVIYQLKDVPIVQNMLLSIQPVIIVMMATLTWSFFTKNLKEEKKKSKVFTLMILAVITLAILNLNAGIVITIAILLSVLYVSILVKKRKKIDLEDK